LRKFYTAPYTAQHHSEKFPPDIPHPLPYTDSGQPKIYDALLLGDKLS